VTFNDTDTLEVQVLAVTAVSVSNGTFSWSLRDWNSSDIKKRNGRIRKKKRNSGKLQDNNGLKISSQVPDREFQSSFEEAATLKGIALEAQRGELVAIVGAVGSGKSSLLLALLGEMEVLTTSLGFKVHCNSDTNAKSCRNTVLISSIHYQLILIPLCGKSVYIVPELV